MEGCMEMGEEGKYVSWCFTPSQPVRLYQGDGEEGDFIVTPSPPE